MDVINFQPYLGQHAVTHLTVNLGLWIVMLVAIFVDLWDGVYTAKKTNQRIHSHKLRVTVEKISEYWRFMLIGFVIDIIALLLPFWHLPYISMIFCIGLVGVEVKSMIEHAKRRKSNVLTATDIIKQIIECSTNSKAKELLKLINDMQTDNQEKDGCV